MRACCPDEEAHAVCARDPGSKACKAQVCPENGPSAISADTLSLLQFERVAAGDAPELPASVDPASGIGVTTNDMPDRASLTRVFQKAGTRLRDDPMLGTPAVESMPDGMAVVEDTRRRSSDKYASRVPEDVSAMPDGAEISALSREETDKATPLGAESVVGSAADMPDGANVMRGVSMLRGDGGAVRMAVDSANDG